MKCVHFFGCYWTPCLFGNKTCLGIVSIASMVGLRLLPALEIQQLWGGYPSAHFPCNSVTQHKAMDERTSSASLCMDVGVARGSGSSSQTLSKNRGGINCVCLNFSMCTDSHGVDAQ
ncbi:hypothetical protein SAY87_005594 [Trapa incisa]|uniref:Uncharacterized protein n=1 Tax=Trapa incisa TaxID=236973 RepID=A0AAN7KAG6_9MYRT|nr:hypothetical protein SAY87_005594 [Trapa incisa]